MKILIELPDDVASALSIKARGAGKDRKNYIQDTLISIAASSVVERYALHFSTTDNSGVTGQIRRFNNDLNGTHTTFIGARTIEQTNAINEASNLVRRNEPGDREEAIHVLKTHFNNVYEMPV